MRAIVDARNLAKAERILLIKNAINKGANGGIVVLADDEHAKEDISHAANKEGWILKGVESRGDNYWITITSPLSDTPEGKWRSQRRCLKGGFRKSAF